MIPASCEHTGRTHNSANMELTDEPVIWTEQRRKSKQTFEFNNSFVSCQSIIKQHPIHAADSHERHTLRRGSELLCSNTVTFHATLMYCMLTTSNSIMKQVEKTTLTFEWPGLMLRCDAYT